MICGKVVLCERLTQSLLRTTFVPKWIEDYSDTGYLVMDGYLFLCYKYLVCTLEMLCNLFSITPRAESEKYYLSW